MIPNFTERLLEGSDDDAMGMANLVSLILRFITLEPLMDLIQDPEGCFQCEV